MRWLNLVPIAWDTIDIAGMGENETHRSGPYVLIVFT